jgi:hypothetical protein
VVVLAVVVFVIVAVGFRRSRTSPDRLEARLFRDTTTPDRSGVLMHALIQWRTDETVPGHYFPRNGSLAIAQ